MSTRLGWRWFGPATAPARQPGPAGPNAAHDHRFGQDRVQPGQRRTAIVLGLTALMMVAEIVAGTIFGSVALLADGLHMGTHALALGVALLAYALARRHAGDERFSFGTGKINALGGFTSGVMLAGFSGLMLVECIARYFAPVPISFDQALAVAGVGLVVNGASALLLVGDRHDGHAHGAHQHHPHDPGSPHTHEHEHEHEQAHPHGHDDHNLHGAYLHVLADALTSVLAIVALLAAKYAGAAWMDPAMGVVGALLVLSWSFGLLRHTGWLLLDRQADDGQLESIRRAIESRPGDRVADLHVWNIGSGLRAMELVVCSAQPLAPDRYRARLPAPLTPAHLVIEVRHAAPLDSRTLADA